jgi:hypothetical protein
VQFNSELNAHNYLLSLPHFELVALMKRLLAAAISVGLLAACSDGPTTPPRPTSLSITTKESFVVAGDTVRIAVSTGGGSTAAVEWESLNPQVATVQGGVVTGVARGSARVVARAGTLADTATVGVLRNSFNVSTADFCENPQFVPVRIAAVGERSIILADTRNPAGALTDAEYRSFAAQFDDAVYPTVAGAFGEPLDVDENGRFIILFTRAVNELTPDPEDGWVAGFVWARDLFPRTPRTLLGLTFPDRCPGSNEAEMTYLAIPDPTWPENIRDYLRRSAIATIAHEFQHAINASRRIFRHNAPPEDVWLNEGMSHIAEELMFYRASGMTPGRSIDLDALRASQARLDAVNGFQIGNLFNFGIYLTAPEAESPLAADTLVGTEARGAAWNLLRYAADRRGGDQSRFWYDLLNSQLSGTANLQRAIGTELLPWMRDWTISLYASGISPDFQQAISPDFQQASWNFRSLLPALFDEFPLAVRSLQDGVTTSTAIRAGSAAYLRFAVAPNQLAEITAGVPGQHPGTSCRETNVIQQLELGDVYQGPAGTVENLCFSGGASGTEYTLIPFHASLTPGATLLVNVVGTGIRQAALPVSTSRTDVGRPFAVDPSQLFGRSGGRSRAEGLHLRLLEREREELARRLPGAGPALRPQTVHSAAAGPLMLAVIRTR